jgi:hypothetical protein
MGIRWVGKLLLNIGWCERFQEVGEKEGGLEVCEREGVQCWCVFKRQNWQGCK